jgi:hypothetical protein
MGRALDHGGGPVRWLAGGGLMIALALPGFLIWPALGGAFLCMALMGLASVISETSHPSYLLTLPEAKALGRRESLSLFYGFYRVGQMCGPPVMAAAWGGWGLGGLAVLGATVAAASLGFWALGQGGGPAGPPGRPQGPEDDA